MVLAFQLRNRLEKNDYGLKIVFFIKLSIENTELIKVFKSTWAKKVTTEMANLSRYLNNFFKIEYNYIKNFSTQSFLKSK